MSTNVDLWKEYQERYMPYRSALLSGRAEMAPDLASAVESLDAYLMAEAPPPSGAFDPIGHAIILKVMIQGSWDTVLRFTVAHHGPVVALDVLARAHGFDVKSVPDKRWVVPAASTSVAMINDHEVARAVAAADAPTAEACLLVARAAWQGAPLGLKTHLACIFPREERWVAEVVEALIAAKGTPPVWLVPIAVSRLVSTMTDVALIEKVVLESGSVVDLGDLLTRLGAAALPLARRIVEAPRERHELKGVASALGAVGGLEVAEIFASSIQHAPMRKATADYFHRFPEYAAPLRERAKGDTRAAKFAQEIVAQLDRAELSSGDEAPLASLPAVLANPPWRAKKRPTRKRIQVADLALAPREETFKKTQAIAELLAQRAEKSASAESLTAWNERGFEPFPAYNTAWTFLLHFEARASQGIARWIERVGESSSHNDTGWVLEPFLALDSPRLAVPMALHLKAPRRAKVAWAWLASNPGSACVGLIPAAVGETGRRRDLAELALRRLVARGHEEVALKIADEYGAPARKSVEEILAWDPRFDCPKTAPKLPPLFRPNAYTRPKLADGRALPLTAMQALGEMLKLSPVDAPYAGLADVRDACDPRSLAELAWDMARAWEIAGAKKADAWMFDALVHLADDEVVRRTTPAIKSPRVLEVLAQIGSDAAIMELATIAARAASGRKSVYFSSASEGEKQLEAVARSKGWTIDELDERVTPTLGTDAMGGLDLDYGTRKVRVGFDESLSPYFQVDGERVRMLPPKRKTDDAELVKAARALWDELAEDVGTLADRRIRAMERALVNGRSWDVPTFRRTWVEHPLMIHLARGVVWIARGPGGARPFRVAEDKTFADQQDDAIDLDGAESVQIAHPLVLGPASIARFSQLFADYRLIQPFPQLAREMVSLTKDESEKETVTRSRTPRSAQPLSEVLAATGRWRMMRSHPRLSFRRDFPELVYADVDTDKEGASITLRFFSDGTPVPLASVDPIRISECLRDAEATATHG